eukprot:2349809-Karenia_brevis.AAC.1
MLLQVLLVAPGCFWACFWYCFWGQGDILEEAICRTPKWAPEWAPRWVHCGCFVSKSWQVGELLGGWHKDK